MAWNQNHIGGVHLIKLSFRQQDNYHHSINIMISSSYHLVASPPTSWQKPSRALAWLAAWCPYSDRRWFVLIRFLLFPRGQAGGHKIESKVFTFFQTAALVWEKAGRAWSEPHETALINASTLPHLDLRRISSNFWTNTSLPFAKSITVSHWLNFKEQNLETCGLSDNRW